jgi:predicted small lipoprotein YifL
VSSPLKLLLACGALALLAFGVAGCGGAAPRLPPRDSDHDIDSLGKSSYDVDNDAVPTFGEAASPTDRAAVAALIKIYYQAAATNNGKAACSLLHNVVAEVAVEEHERGKGPISLRGNTCPQVLSKIFESRHGELVEDAAAPHVLWVRVKGKRGVTVVRFGATRERRIYVYRSPQGGWKMDSLLDSGTP